MKIEKIRNSSELTLAVEGRIDAKTAPELESVLDEALDGVTGLTFDLKQVTYISSAGLRVFLKVQKQMNAAAAAAAAAAASSGGVSVVSTQKIPNCLGTGGTIITTYSDGSTSTSSY